MSLPKPNEPIDRISITTSPTYNLANDIAHAYGFKVTCEDEHVLTATSRRDIDGSFFDALFAWARQAGFFGRINRLKPSKVIINDPATVVFFDDNSKTVTKAKWGDSYDPLFGIMACALRKVGRNRVSIDSWEPVIEFLADYLADADECRTIADMLYATADALELDGVMDDVEEYDARTVAKATSYGEREHVGYERTRQTIRNLIDMGEL